MTPKLERLSLTETAHNYRLGERLRLRLMVALLTLVGKCLCRRAKPARFGCHLPTTHCMPLLWDALQADTELVHAHVTRSSSQRTPRSSDGARPSLLLSREHLSAEDFCRTLSFFDVASGEIHLTAARDPSTVGLCIRRRSRSTPGEAPQHSWEF